MMYLFNNEDFIKVISKTFGYSVDSIISKDSKIWVVSQKRYMILKHVLVYPFGMYFPKLTLDSREVDVLFSSLKKKSFGLCKININPLDENKIEYKKKLKKLGFIKKEGKTHILELALKYEDTFKNFNSTRRNETNKEIGNYEIFEANTTPEWIDYYEIYLESVKRWGLDSPIYKKEFILNLQEVNNVKLWLFRYEGKIISGMIVFYGEKDAFYWHGAALISKEYKKLFSVVKLMNHLIRDLYKNQIYYLNMGASDGLDGVRKFKESFGAKEYVFTTFEYKSVLYKLIETLKKILHK